MSGDPTAPTPSTDGAPGRVGRGSRTLRIFGMSCLALLTGVGCLSSLERYYLVHGQHYPSWLASGKLDSVDEVTLARLRATTCSTTLEVFRKPSVTVVRCGVPLYLPTTRTYVAPAGS